MPNALPTPLIAKRFRANPGYEFLLREQTVDCEGALPPLLLFDEPFYGYLRPKPSSHLAWRPVSPDTALLFFTLQGEGKVPGHFRSLFRGRTEHRLLRLVLDEILEVEHEGTFVSGAGARNSIIGDHAYGGKGPLASLSIEALRYVEALGELTVPEMTQRLYYFGRRPVTSAQKRTFDRAGVATFSGFLGKVPPTLDKYWVPARSVNSHWVMWYPIRNNDDGEPARFKLYVSPGLSDVPEAFSASVDILGQRTGVTGLKLGRGLTGLTRPDKLVAYFSRLDALQEAGAALHRQLAGTAVHGVPFTAELSPDGLLSWGPEWPRTVPDEPESWRLWLARKLATHLETARRGAVSGPLWRFAVDRLSLDGVNPDFWAPNAEFWTSLGVAT